MRATSIYRARRGRRHRAWGAWLADGERVRREAERLPVTSLVVVEVLLDCAGCLDEKALSTEVARRMGGGDRALVGAALERLYASGLAVTLTSHADRLVALVAEGAAHLRHVRGMSLPPPPPDDLAHALPSPALERQLIAIATLAAHRKLRENTDGWPNRSTVKDVRQEPRPGCGEPRAEDPRGLRVPPSPGP